MAVAQMSFLIPSIFISEELGEEQRVAECFTSKRGGEFLQETLDLQSMLSDSTRGQPNQL